MDKMDDKELINNYITTHVNYNESYDEKMVLFTKYTRIRNRCDAKPFFFSDTRDVKIKCYTDMLNACIEYDNKRKLTKQLDDLKDKYYYELKKRNYHLTI